MRQSSCLQIFISLYQKPVPETRTSGPVVERPFRDWGVVGSNPGRAIPKALKMVPVATWLGAQQYKASTGFSSPHKYRTFNIATLTKIK